MMDQLSKRWLWRLLVAGGVSAVAGLFALGGIRPRVGHPARGAHGAQRSLAGVGIARLPLTFVPNVGQLNSRARYVS